MSEKVSNNPEVQSDYETFERGYDAGVADERERIIQYLIDKEILRESMFGNSWVALHHYEAHGIDLDKKLGGN